MPNQELVIHSGQEGLRTVELFRSVCNEFKLNHAGEEVLLNKHSGKFVKCTIDLLKALSNKDVKSSPFFGWSSETRSEDLRTVKAVDVINLFQIAYDKSELNHAGAQLLNKRIDRFEECMTELIKALSDKDFKINATPVLLGDSVPGEFHSRTLFGAGG